MERGGVACNALSGRGIRCPALKADGSSEKKLFVDFLIDTAIASRTMGVVVGAQLPDANGSNHCGVTLIFGYCDGTN